MPALQKARAMGLGYGEGLRWMKQQRGVRAKKIRAKEGWRNG
jgi:hypothetical protein